MSIIVTKMMIIVIIVLGDLSGATSFYIFTSFSPFKIFPLFPTSLLPYARAHGAHGFSIRYPLYSPFFLNIFTPRQQGWLALTISRSLICNLLSNTHEGLDFSSFAHLKKILGVSLPKTNETFCVFFFNKTLRNRHLKSRFAMVLTSSSCNLGIYFR